MNKKNILFVLGLASAIFVSNCSSDSSTAATGTGASTNTDTSGTDKNTSDKTASDKIYTQKQYDDAVAAAKAQAQQPATPTYDLNYYLSGGFHPYGLSLDELRVHSKTAEGVLKSQFEDKGDKTSDNYKALSDVVAKMNNLMGWMKDPATFKPIAGQADEVYADYVDAKYSASEADKKLEDEWFAALIKLVSPSALSVPSALKEYTRLMADPNINKKVNRDLNRRLGAIIINNAGDATFQKETGINGASPVVSTATPPTVSGYPLLVGAPAKDMYMRIFTEVVSYLSLVTDGSSAYEKALVSFLSSPVAYKNDKTEECKRYKTLINLVATGDAEILATKNVKIGGTDIALEYTIAKINTLEQLFDVVNPDGFGATAKALVLGSAILTAETDACGAGSTKAGSILYPSDATPAKKLTLKTDQDDYFANRAAVLIAAGADKNKFV